MEHVIVDGKGLVESTPVAQYVFAAGGLTVVSCQLAIGRRGEASTVSEVGNP